jgi:NhaA family Na+:H+ antiporter
MTRVRFGAGRLTRPVARFLALESSGGLLLLVATVAALVWANSPWKGGYGSFIHYDLSVHGGPIDLDLTVQEFVNDALMAVFFFVVGLEIKRELLRGELRDRRTAALPVIAAIGGMIVPALLYLTINAGTTTSNGWGIPMATDIAFAVGIVSLLGNRVPVSLKLFLLSLAVVDDLGAIAVIAVYYSSSIRFAWLFASIGVLLLVPVLRLLRVRFVAVYLLVGVVAWYLMFRSGVHATVAGVALGFLIPLDAPRPEIDDRSISDRLENALHPWSSYVVIPVFALCNAGVLLTGGAMRDALSSRVTWGVGVGLVVGKTIGVAGASMLAIRFGLARRPRGVTGTHLVGIAMAAGIGFTVALFVTGLAFTNPASSDQARIGILGASVVAAILSALVLRFAASRASPDELAIEATENAELLE